MTLDELKVESAKLNVRSELTIKLLETMENFKSEKHPDYELTMNDMVYVLSSMIRRAADE
jgi:hypothetical protein